ncbi:MAG TPA: 1-acyl-sn-glycerol-3-phosphate acyltransferase [Bacteroidales bacterium]|nr:1-acyl-sn-glycerol-3-phosphate acyltransferase [Bacteroidales bacterium]
MQDKTIDIGQAIRKSKSPFVRNLPRFMIRMIERIIYQDEMNATIARSAEKSGIYFVNSILNDWNVKVTVRDSENLPSSGNFVFVANHPVGAMDSLAFLVMIDRYYKNVISPSNELFNYIPQLRPLILGVNVFGRNTRETADKLNQLFSSESQIMIFPSGEVSRRTKGNIEDPDWQKTFVTKSIAYKRDIIPVFISGRNSNFFYFVANLRKMLGIKLYIETVLLPREMMKQRNSEVVLTVGKPIPWLSLNNGKNHSELAREIKTIVYDIPKQTART